VRTEVKGEPVAPINPAPGCRFAPRCPLASEECVETTPALEEKDPRQFVACIKV
jgi:oligopeptide/dipeptide ABC transporter ATP-binding protein